jgi:rare lipoprotein A
MRWRNNLVPALALTLIACGSFDGIDDGSARAKPRAETPPPPLPAEEVKLGEPYQAGGQSFTPRDDATYDEVGYASTYGEELRGSDTGNGETYNPDGISAAHRTLPLPSYIEVTNLDTGRTILARVNDRGPFAKGRILDLSTGAMRQLGIEGQGVIPVRVRRVNPPEYERNALRNGGKAIERLPTPPGLLSALRVKLKDQPAPSQVAAAAPPAKVAPKPKPMIKPTQPAVGADFPPPEAASRPAPRPAPVAKPVVVAKPAPATPADDRFIEEEAGRPHWRKGAGQSPPAARPDVAPQPVASSAAYFIQVAAFSNAGSAKSLAGKVGGQVVSAGSINRVRTGPYTDEATARAALGRIHAKGYRDARITH